MELPDCSGLAVCCEPAPAQRNELLNCHQLTYWQLIVSVLLYRDCKFTAAPVRKVFRVAVAKALAE